MKALVLFSALALASASFGQSPPDNYTANDAAPVKAEKSKKEKAKKPGKGPIAEVGSGVGAGAAGVGKGAADLVTLHPINAGEAVGTGAVKAGKDVTVGSAKGVGKVGKGVGHVLKKIF